MIGENCGCKSADYVAVWEHDVKTLTMPYCLDINHGIEKVIKWDKCATEFAKYYLGICFDRCSPMCRKVVFSPVVHMSRWPAKPHEMAFYEHHIKGKPYEDKF